MALLVKGHVPRSIGWFLKKLLMENRKKDIAVYALLTFIIIIEIVVFIHLGKAKGIISKGKLYKMKIFVYIVYSYL